MTHMSKISALLGPLEFIRFPVHATRFKRCISEETTGLGNGESLSSVKATSRRLVYILQNQALSARIFVRESKAGCMYLKDTGDASNGFKPVLTGDGPVFEASFSRNGICSQPIPDLLYVTE